MLANSSLSTAFPLADKLAISGHALKALDSTPLAELITASLMHAQVDAALPAGPAGVEVSSFSFHENLIAGSTQQTADGRYPHDEIMEAAVNAVAGSVQRTLDLTRNTITPTIKTVYEHVQTCMDACADSALASPSIVPMYFKSIWDSAAFNDLISVHASAPLMAFPIKALPIGEPVSFKEALATGSAGIDGDVFAFVDEIGEDYVRQTWNLAFGPSAVSTLGDVISGREFDRAILVYLFARRLMDNIPEGVPMPLEDWRMYMASLMSQAGRNCLRIQEKRASDRRLKVLVIDMPSGDHPSGEIKVVGETYDDFLRDGGTPELLFGSAYSSRETYYPDLIKSAERYTKVWTNAYALLQSRAGYARFDGLATGLRSAVTAAIQAVPDDQLLVDRSTLHQLLRDRLAMLKLSDLEDLWGTCRKVVCRVIYPHTDAEKILVSIDAAGATNPSIDPREAALLATMDFVVAWLMKLLQVEHYTDNG